MTTWCISRSGHYIFHFLMMSEISLPITLFFYALVWEWVSVIPATSLCFLPQDREVSLNYSEMCDTLGCQRRHTRVKMWWAGQKSGEIWIDPLGCRWVRIDCLLFAWAINLKKKCLNLLKCKKKLSFTFSKKNQLRCFYWRLSGEHTVSHKPRKDKW